MSKPTRGGFVYKPPSKESLDARANRSKGFDKIFKEDFTIFSAGQGDNNVRYLPPPEGSEQGHYGLNIWVHYGIGGGERGSSYLCLNKMLNKRCPICEQAQESEQAGEKDEAYKLAPKERVVSWILDRNAKDPDEPILWIQSTAQDSEIVGLSKHRRTGEYLTIADPNNGYDVFFRRQGTTMKNTKYSNWAIDRDPSPIVDNQNVFDDIVDFIEGHELKNLLNFFDYAHIKGVLSGTTASRDELDEPAKEEEPPFEGGRRTRRTVDDDPPAAAAEAPEPERVPERRVPRAVPRQDPEDTGDEQEIPRRRVTR